MTRKESVKIIVFSNLLGGGSLNIELFLGGGDVHIPDSVENYLVFDFFICNDR